MVGHTRISNQQSGTTMNWKNVWNPLLILRIYGCVPLGEIFLHIAVNLA